MEEAAEAVVPADGGEVGVAVIGERVQGSRLC